MPLFPGGINDNLTQRSSTFKKIVSPYWQVSMIKKKLSLSVVLLFGGIIVVFQAWDKIAEAENAQDRVDFLRDIQPIFNASCGDCHGTKKQSGNLRLDSKRIALARAI